MSARRFYPSALWCGLVLLAAGCGRSNGDPAEAANVGPARQVHTTRLTALDRVEILRLIGSVEPAHDVTVSAEVQGRLAARLVDVGNVVEPGALLMQIDDERLQFQVVRAEAELERLKASLDKRRLDLKRAQNLYEDQVASEDALEAARTEVRVSEASVHAQAAQVQQVRRDLSDTQVRSPLAGQIVECAVDAGELVRPGMILVRIVDTSSIKIVTRINEVDLVKLRVGTEATITCDAYPGYPLQAAVTAIADQADARTRTFPVEIALPNRAERPLKAGMVARIEVPGDRFPRALLVRQDVILERGGRSLVYVVQPDGTVEERVVAAGKVLGTEVVITDGLADGDEIVVRGQFTLNDGDPVQVVDVTS